MLCTCSAGSSESLWAGMARRAPARVPLLASVLCSAFAAGSGLGSLAGVDSSSGRSVSVGSSTGSTRWLAGSRAAADNARCSSRCDSQHAVAQREPCRASEQKAVIVPPAGPAAMKTSISKPPHGSISAAAVRSTQTSIVPRPVWSMQGTVQECWSSSTPTAEGGSVEESDGTEQRADRPQRGDSSRTPSCTGSCRKKHPRSPMIHPKSK